MTLLLVRMGSSRLRVAMIKKQISGIPRPVRFYIRSPVTRRLLSVSHLARMARTWQLPVRMVPRESGMLRQPTNYFLFPLLTPKITGTDGLTTTQMGHGSLPTILIATPEYGTLFPEKN